MPNLTPTLSSDEGLNNLFDKHRVAYAHESERVIDELALKQAIKKLLVEAVRRSIKHIDKISYPPSGKEYWFSDGTFQNDLYGAARKAIELSSLKDGE